MSTSKSGGGTAASPTGPGSSDGGNGAPNWLYQGWLTGWAYQACHDLYPWNQGPSSLLTKDGKLPKGGKDLLDWLYAYSNLVGLWGTVGLKELADGLSAMREQVHPSSDGTKKGSPLKELSKDQFEVWFLEIEGAARTKGPYVRDVMEFSSVASQWSYLATVKQKQDGRGAAETLDPEASKRWDRAEREKQTQLFEKLHDNLLPKIESAVPASAHEIIEDDTERLLRMWRDGLSRTERIERSLILHSPLPRKGKRSAQKKDLADEQFKLKRQDLAREWSELILSGKSAREVLNWPGRTTLYILLGIIGTGSLLFVGFTFVFLILLIPAAFGVSLSKLSLSDINTILAILTAVGITLPLLAKKVWGGMIATEHQLAIKLTRVALFRRNSFFRDQLKEYSARPSREAAALDAVNPPTGIE